MELGLPSAALLYRGEADKSLAETGSHRISMHLILPTTCWQALSPMLLAFNGPTTHSRLMPSSNKVQKLLGPNPTPGSAKQLLRV